MDRDNKKKDKKEDKNFVKTLSEGFENDGIEFIGDEKFITGVKEGFSYLKKIKGFFGESTQNIIILFVVSALVFGIVKVSKELDELRDEVSALNKQTLKLKQETMFAFGEDGNVTILFDDLNKRTKSLDDDVAILTSEVAEIKDKLPEKKK